MKICSEQAMIYRTRERERERERERDEHVFHMVYNSCM
jgi:hypothetical protein